MNFGEKIKNARLAKGFSQAELAKQSGISLRTIQNYELGARIPKSKDTYTRLADALGIDKEVLLDENAAFVIRANAQYGSRGAAQAWNLAADIGNLWAGGEIEDEDMDAIMQALQESYWAAKKNNRKFVNKRYLKEGEDYSGG